MPEASQSPCLTFSKAYGQDLPGQLTEGGTFQQWGKGGGKERDAGVKQQEEWRNRHVKRQDIENLEF